MFQLAPKFLGVLGMVLLVLEQQFVLAYRMPLALRLARYAPTPAALTELAALQPRSPIVTLLQAVYGQAVVMGR